ncbi:hypothetical protein HDE_05517 [Halotydeus destructor]|nr:hypothetical protein HDE_05517 [Halotydeus destructor]
MMHEACEESNYSGILRNMGRVSNDDEERKKKHRDTERVRHNEITALMRKINDFVPGKSNIGRETQVNFLKRAARYSAFLGEVEKLSDSDLNNINETMLAEMYNRSAEYVDTLYNEGMDPDYKDSLLQDFSEMDHQARLLMEPICGSFAKEPMSQG